MAEYTKPECVEYHLTEKSDDHQLEELRDRIKYLTIRLGNEESNNFVLMKKVQDGETRCKMMVEAVEDLKQQIDCQDRLSN